MSQKVTAMSMSRTVQEDQSQRTMQLNLFTKTYKLTLNKDFCVGCQICTLACPKEAIKLEKQPRAPSGNVEKAQVTIDLNKCNFCGICDLLCPYGAMNVTVSGEHILSVVDKESFPELIRDIKIDAGKSQSASVECEKACPLGLISVTRPTSEEKDIQGPNSLAQKDISGLKIDSEHCPCCRICEFKCPEGMIQVQKFFHGQIAINDTECPKDCRDCLDVCPITGALYLSDEDKKVHANEMYCVYCGACKVVCPIDKALELTRTMIRHTPVKSGAWNKALERLASPIGITKELKTKGTLRARESLAKRLGLKED